MECLVGDPGELSFIYLSSFSLACALLVTTVNCFKLFRYLEVTNKKDPYLYIYIYFSFLLKFQQCMKFGASIFSVSFIGGFS